MRNLISDKFLGGKKKDSPLSKVAEYAANLSSLSDLQQFVKAQFENLSPADFHKILPTFRWRLIFTTNFDTVLEAAYDSVPNRLQNLAPVIRDGDNFQRKIADAKTLPLVKLHGCISVASDPQLPLILTSEQYAKYQTNRLRLFGHLKEFGREYPLIFCGYDISDPNLQQILFDLGDLGINRPMYATINPSLDDLDTAYLSGRRVHPVKATFEDFLNYIDREVPTGTRSLSILVDQNQLPIGRWFRAKASPSTELLTALSSDLEHVHPQVSSPPADPAIFYHGFGCPWSIFEKELDVRRRVTDDILSECVLVDESVTGLRCVLLKGHAGSGKNVVLRRVAWEAGVQHDALILYLREGGILRGDILLELFRLLQQRLVIFIDDVLEHFKEILEVVGLARRNTLPLTLVFGARTNEWNVGGEELAPAVNLEFELRDLSESEIHSLLAKLEDNNCLGELVHSSPQERIRKFSLYAERQLLVALHEATSGKPFEQLVFDEYENVVPPEAKVLYLDICSLHRLDITVRAGLVSRISGINFERFKQEFFRPLEHVIRAYPDRRSGDFVYRTRHPLIARFVFERALQDQTQRADQIVRILSCLNVDYDADAWAFEQLIKGRDLAELFADRSLADEIYKSARQTGASIAHIAHQEAVFELNHPNGSPRRALAAVAEAGRAANSESLAVAHTKAMALRKLASTSQHDLEKEKYRSEARLILRSQLGQTRESHPYHTLGQITLDEIREKLTKLPAGSDATESSDLTDRVLAGLISDMDTILSEGLQRFPGDAHLLSLQATVLQLVGDEPKAIKALEDALRKTPSNEVVASRLASSYVRLGRLDEAQEVLTTCLDSRPGAKRAHFEMAKIRISSVMPPPYEEILYHLRRSFTEGDTNYEAQLLYAIHHYLHGDRNEAKRMFKLLSAQRVAPEIRSQRAELVREPDQSPREYRGSIDRLFATYCFVYVPVLNDSIFVLVSDFPSPDRDQLSYNAPVTCNLAFTFRGACGTNPHLLE